MNKRNNYSPVFKTKVALDAIKGSLTLSELASKYNVNPQIINKWKNEVVKNIQGVFEGKIKTYNNQQNKDIAKLNEKINKLQLDIDFLERASSL